MLACAAENSVVSLLYILGCVCCQRHWQRPFFLLCSVVRRDGLTGRFFSPPFFYVFLHWLSVCCVRRQFVKNFFSVEFWDCAANIPVIATASIESPVITVLLAFLCCRYVPVCAVCAVSARSCLAVVCTICRDGFRYFGNIFVENVVFLLLP